MKTCDHKINIGGMMRCCFACLSEDKTEAKEGDFRVCKYCGDKLELTVFGWEWLLANQEVAE